MGKASKGYWDLTQGDPLTTTIFNAVVGDVVRHWVAMALDEAEKREERGNEGWHQSALLYVDNGMVASSDPRWLQWVFDALFSLFERVGLWTNVGKTVSMVFGPCWAVGTQLVAAYRRKMTREGPTYRERHKERVQCRECGKEMAAGALAPHRMTQHGQRQISDVAWKPRPWEATQRRIGWPS